MKTKALLSALLVSLSLACSQPRPAPQPIPTPTPTAIPQPVREATIVPTESVTVNGVPLVRNKKGQFAKYYWHEGTLYIPEKISQADYELALQDKPESNTTED